MFDDDGAFLLFTNAYNEKKKGLGDVLPGRRVHAGNGHDGRDFAVLLDVKGDFGPDGRILREGGGELGEFGRCPRARWKRVVDLIAHGDEDARR